MRRPGGCGGSHSSPSPGLPLPPARGGASLLFELGTEMRLAPRGAETETKHKKRGGHETPLPPGYSARRFPRPSRSLPFEPRTPEVRASGLTRRCRLSLRRARAHTGKKTTRTTPTTSTATARASPAFPFRSWRLAEPPRGPYAAPGGPFAQERPQRSQDSGSEACARGPAGGKAHTQSPPRQRENYNSQHSLR